MVSPLVQRVPRSERFPTLGRCSVLKRAEAANLPPQYKQAAGASAAAESPQAAAI